jgi:hypothetical protein
MGYIKLRPSCMYVFMEMQMDLYKRNRSPGRRNRGAPGAV